MTSPTAQPPLSPSNAHELAFEIDKHKIAVMGSLFALPPLLDPSMPLLTYYIQRHGQNHISPAIIYRTDGSLYSMEPMKTWLSRAAASGGGPGMGLGPELMTLPMLYVMTRIGDQMDRLKLYAADVPITQFVRHLRNACAHGNRWHFTMTKRGHEPVNPATCRSMMLSASLHDQRALWGEGCLVGSPGDYLDVLDDLVTYLRTLPNPTGHTPSPVPNLPPPPQPEPSEPYVDPQDIPGMEHHFDQEMPGWRDRYTQDLEGVDMPATIARTRAYLESIIRVTEAGGLGTSGLSADQAVASVCKNVLAYFTSRDRGSPTN